MRRVMGDIGRSSPLIRKEEIGPDSGATLERMVSQLERTVSGGSLAGEEGFEPSIP
jgi:hypothetical protein